MHEATIDVGQLVASAAANRAMNVVLPCTGPVPCPTLCDGAFSVGAVYTRPSGALCTCHCVYPANTTTAAGCVSAGPACQGGGPSLALFVSSGGGWTGGEIFGVVVASLLVTIVVGLLAYRATASKLSSSVKARGPYTGAVEMVMPHDGNAA